MLFEERFRGAVQDGSVTLTFRRWKRTQAIAGHRYRTAVGILEVDAVDIVETASITDADARRSGYLSAPAVVADLRGADDLPVYRVRFHAVPGPDPRDELAHDDALTDADVQAIDRRLDRLDAASSHGAWTRETLAIIGRQPEVRAGDLAEVLGRERAPFKLDVRKLKNVGLTLSLPVGYRLSPRGEAYVARSRRE